MNRDLSRVYLTPPWIASRPQCPTWIAAVRPVEEPLRSQVEAVAGRYFRERDAVDRILIEGALRNLFREGR